MNKLHITIITFIISCVMCTVVSASAHIYDVGVFDGLNVGDNFNVSVVTGPAPSVEVEIPDEIRESVICEVENGILKLSFDKSKLPKDFKPAQVLKQPFNASVTVSSSLSFIKIGGKSTICTQDGAVSGDDVSVCATDQAVVTSLSIANSAKASLILSKRAEACIDVTANSLMVTTDNGTSLSVNMKVSDCTVESKGSSNIVINGDASNSKFISGDSSKLIINGRTGETSYNCQGASSANASNAECPAAVVSMTGGCFLSISASESLSIESLSNGSRLEYYGTPSIAIGQIKNSSVLHVDQK